MPSQNIRKTQSILLQWGRENFRDYPWRHTQDPYKIMIAEFMLHRTKANQVAPVYSSFIQKYPDVFSLARADHEDVRKVTEHLGLHWRSGHFIESARYIVENFSGHFPDTEEELRVVPGIGAYVAGAILAVSYGKPNPVVDSNIARFINRFWGLKLCGEIRRNREIQNIARELFEVDDPGSFLFAILDFTAKICKPKCPVHSICPLKEMCVCYREEYEALSRG